MPDLEFAHTVLLVDCDPIDEAPVWDLRIRKGVRRHGTKVVVASARPTALDPIATATLRFAPGGGEGFLVALDAALTGDTGNLGGAASASGSNATAIREFADALRAAGEEVVIVYGERALTRQRRPRAAERRLAARASAGSPAPGLLALPGHAERPRRARGGLRPRPRPGLRDAGRARPRRRGDRRGPGERRAAHGLAAPRRPAAQLPEPLRLGAARSAPRRP